MLKAQLTTSSRVHHIFAAQVVEGRGADLRDSRGIPQGQDGALSAKHLQELVCLQRPPVLLSPYIMHTTTYKHTDRDY